MKLVKKNLKNSTCCLNNESWHTPLTSRLMLMTTANNWHIHNISIFIYFIIYENLYSNKLMSAGHNFLFPIDDLYWITEREAQTDARVGIIVSKHHRKKNKNNRKIICENSALKRMRQWVRTGQIDFLLQSFIMWCFSCDIFRVFVFQTGRQHHQYNEQWQSRRSYIYNDTRKKPTDIILWTSEKSSI